MLSLTFIIVSFVITACHCTFLVPSVTYLGYRIDSQELYPVPKKVCAIQNAPKPHNQLSLKSYLGLLSYYSRFLPNLPNTLPHCIVYYAIPYSGNRESKKVMLLKLQWIYYCLLRFWYILIQYIPLF